MKRKLVEVYRARGEAEAEIVKSKLESYGIPSILKSNAAPSVYAFTVDGMGEYKVMVWEELAEEAKELVAGEDNV
jgi:meiotically up-regulated gene 157 (Mug157) protein